VSSGVLVRGNWWALPHFVQDICKRADSLAHDFPVGIWT